MGPDENKKEISDPDAEGTEPDRGEETEETQDTLSRRPAWRQVFMLVLSVIVIAVVLWVSYCYGDILFGFSDSDGKEYLIPYVTALSGVLLFIMNVARKKKKEWKLRDFWGDHCFRIAQSFAYLFFIMWAYYKVTNGGGDEGGDEASNPASMTLALTPNILGFLVGLYILRVERAMDGFGDKFEEIITAILPRATRYVSTEERRRQQLRMVYKIEDIGTQYEALRPRIEDPAAQFKIDKLIDEAHSAAEGEDPDKVKPAVDALTRAFEEAKKSMGEVLVPLDEFVGSIDKEKPDKDVDSDTE